ncbi:aa3-type cytochrome c oxidase subunit IV [Sandaracinobacteroides hominis]|mgnify:CR=1 FL=1|uniref:aa3-type cytochrome c oxidase subunit IV n=1 Tax=Sandaracinobacteroides hominis TaxID=2780086 RepID=UPI0018F33599|nr:aa3-type cytochrome c oxidase subunit IV [Sandaracinobacteroides hominis]
MAEAHHGADPHGTTQGVSWETANGDHREVYTGFLGLTKWAILFVVIVLIGMALFLV